MIEFDEKKYSVLNMWWREQEGTIFMASIKKGEDHITVFDSLDGQEGWKENRLYVIFERRLKWSESVETGY